MKNGILKFVVFAVILLSAMFSSVSADVIWEPEDSFYSAHSNDCYNVSDRYLTNGSEGYVFVYQNPNSSSPKAFILNGNDIFVSFAYDSKNGSMGVIEYNLDENGNLIPVDYSQKVETGWVYLTDLKPKYMSDEFYADHSSEIVELEEPMYITAGAEVRFHIYPGSAESLDPFTADGDILFNTVYTDAAGVVWGYTPYYRGIRDYWAAISVPDAPPQGAVELPPVTEEPVIPPAAPSDEDISKIKGGMDNLLLIAITAVAAVVVITLVIVFIVIGTKKKRAGGKK